MAEKLEKSKGFIEEFKEMKEKNSTLFGAMYNCENGKIKKFIFCEDLKTRDNNQFVFSKIWNGDIELFEKEPRYVIYNDVDASGMIFNYRSSKTTGAFTNNCNWKSIKDCLIGIDKELREDELFDQKFAFTLRDTGKFKIAQVEENE